MKYYSLGTIGYQGGFPVYVLLGNINEIFLGSIG